MHSTLTVHGLESSTCNLLAAAMATAPDLEGIYRKTGSLAMPVPGENYCSFTEPKKIHKTLYMQRAILSFEPCRAHNQYARPFSFPH